MPLHTCISNNCSSCDIRPHIKCSFKKSDLYIFYLFSFPSIILGGYLLFGISVIYFAVWVAFVFIFFGFLEIRVLCSHCPHYAESTGTLQCRANYGMPKIWKFRPGPMNIIEKIIFISGLTVVFFTPAIILFLNFILIPAAVHALLVVAFFVFLIKKNCVRCMNFACLLNRVDKDIRYKFRKYNPVMY